MNNEFPNLQSLVEGLDPDAGSLSREQFRALLCEDCDFYGEDHEDDLECSCYRMLKLLIERGAMTPGQLARALATREES